MKNTITVRCEKCKMDVRAVRIRTHPDIRLYKCMLCGKLVNKPKGKIKNG